MLLTQPHVSARLARAPIQAGFGGAAKAFYLAYYAQHGEWRVSADLAGVGGANPMYSTNSTDPYPPTAAAWRSRCYWTGAIQQRALRLACTRGDRGARGTAPTFVKEACSSKRCGGKPSVGPMRGLSREECQEHCGADPACNFIE